MNYINTKRKTKHQQNLLVIQHPLWRQADGCRAGWLTAGQSSGSDVEVRETQRRKLAAHRCNFSPLCTTLEHCRKRARPKGENKHNSQRTRNMSLSWGRYGSGKVPFSTKVCRIIKLLHRKDNSAFESSSHPYSCAVVEFSYFDENHVSHHGWGGTCLDPNKHTCF